MTDDWVSSVLERESRDNHNRGGSRRDESGSSRSRRDRSYDDERRSSRRHHSPERRHHGSSRRRSRSPHSRRSPRREDRELTQEERDARTVICLNLSNKIDERDLKDFFRDTGRIRAIKVIRDTHTGRSKGCAYIEFYEVDSVNRAVELTGKKLFGFSIQVETSKAEMNREYAERKATVKAVVAVGGRKIRIQNVHKNIDANMLKDVFKIYGTISECVVTKDTLARDGTQVAHITFSTPQTAKKVAQEMDNFELAEHKLRITQLTETSSNSGRSVLDSDVVDRGGVNLGKSGRYALMAKLAEGSGIQMPEYNSSYSAYSNTNSENTSVFTKPANQNLPTQCLVISNFFNGKEKLSNEQKTKIRDEVIEQCNKHGGVFHVVVDETSVDGNVYLKCQTVGTAIACFAAFNDNDYEERKLAATYLPISTYHDLFPEAVQSYMLLYPSTKLNALNYTN